MIPTMLVLGFVAALVPRGWLLVAAASAAAAIYGSTTATYSDSGNAVGFTILVFAVFAANGAVGMAVGLALKRMLLHARGNPVTLGDHPRRSADRP